MEWQTLFLYVQEILYTKGVVQGKIVRPMRIVDPEQDDYCGLVQAGIECESTLSLPWNSIYTVKTGETTVWRLQHYLSSVKP